MQHLWSTTKRSTIKWGMPVFIVWFFFLMELFFLNTFRKQITNQYLSSASCVPITLPGMLEDSEMEKTATLPSRSYTCKCRVGVGWGFHKDSIRNHEGRNQNAMGESNSSNSLKALETIVVRTLLTKKAEDMSLKVFIEIKQQTWDVLKNFYLNGSCKPSVYLPRSSMKSALCFIRLSYPLLSLRLRTIVPVVWYSSILGSRQLDGLLFGEQRYSY